MISIEDAANTLIPDLFMEKEPGYDAWFSEKVEGALAALKTGASTAEEHDIVMQRVWGRLTQTR